MTKTKGKKVLQESDTTEVESNDETKVETVHTIKSVTMELLKNGEIEIKVLQDKVWEHFRNKVYNSRNFVVEEKKVRGEVVAILYFIKRGFYKNMATTHTIETTNGTLSVKNNNKVKLLEKNVNIIV